jgi:hypothetical protein
MTVQINRSATSPLRGAALRNTTRALLQQMASSRQFAAAQMRITQQGDNLGISDGVGRGGTLMQGSVVFRDGSPSTVIVQMTLSGIAAGPSMVRNVNAALDQAAAQLRTGQAAAAPAAAAGGGTRQRAPRDPARALNVFEAISQSFQQGVERAFGTPTAPAPPATVPDLPGVPPATPGVLRPPGKPLPPPGYVAPLQPYVAPATGVPWGWIAGGALAVTGVVLLVSMAKSEREREQ